MQSTIQELEREIEQFHKNVKDSNDLMKILMSIASLTKSQTDTFEENTKSLQDGLAKLPPELNDLFRKKIEEFVSEVHKEHQEYQTAVSDIMEHYKESVTLAEASISKIPALLKVQTEAAHKKYLEDLSSVEATHTKEMSTAIDGYVGKIDSATETISKVPENLEKHLQQGRKQSVEDLKQIQEQYAESLSKTNGEFSKRLQNIAEKMQAIPEQIKSDSTQQYEAFLEKISNVVDSRIAELKQTENRVISLSQQLETKYDAFVSKLEATNVDQLYKFCQDMNKSINTKLGIALGGIAIAVIISIISLFL